MSLSNFDVLRIAYLTFVGRTHVFDVLGNKKWNVTGIENWVQTELLVAYTDRGYNVTTKGKIARDCDLIVDNVGIELRTGTDTASRWLIKAIQDHPGADLYLFLSKTSEALVTELEQYFYNNNVIADMRLLNDEWMVMTAKKVTNIPPSYSSSRINIIP